MAILFTDRAANKVCSLLQERGGGLGIRLMVQSSECSGMAYRLVFVDAAEEGDLIFESRGANIYVDAKSLVWADGTVIDFLQFEDQSGFSFKNPNAKSQCECGDSFNV